MIQSAKRVNLVSLKLVKEASLLFKPRQITSPDDAFHLLKNFICDKDREHFIVVTLDTNNQPLHINICHIGSLNASMIHPREIMKTAILSNAFSIMVAHNHPSGQCEPSHADIQTTKRIQKVANLLVIELLDHLIIGNEKFISLRQEGYM